jgi:transposase
MARLALRGTLTLAQVVDWLTGAQFRRQLGALPVLYTLLETLQVREVINLYCPTRAEIDYGTVALILVLNRLTMPLPLYRVGDWMARTVLESVLGVPARKLNDDRLARMLDAIQPHCAAIWQEVIQRALLQAEVDLSLVFYDLTALITHGTHAGSQYLDFGFANNTPKNKRKFKVGYNVSADGHVPVAYAPWSGRTTDMATVQENMTQLKRFLAQCGHGCDEVMVVGDRATLSDKLALAYDDHHLYYLAGLRLLKKAHRALLIQPTQDQFQAHPLSEKRGRCGYWGVLCAVPFEYQGRQVTHRGLVVLSGPMRSSLRRTRAKQLRQLRQELQTVRDKIGRPRYQSVKAVQRSANAKLKASPVGKLMCAQAYSDPHGQICLHYWTDRNSLWQRAQWDGRYLLVTNDWSLSAQQIFARYHSKDGVEKRIRVSKQDLKVAPLYLHKDERIEAMLLVNMLALLAYSLLERQVRQNGLQITTRQIIAKLQSLDVVVTCCWDGSQLYRLTPMDEEQTALLQTLADALAGLSVPRGPHPTLSAEQCLLLALPPPQKEGTVA